MCPGAFWAAEAVPGLVSETVPVHSREPVPALRPDPLHLWSGSSIQRGPELRHPATLGYHWLAADHLHGKGAGFQIVTCVTWVSLVHIS